MRLWELTIYSWLSTGSPHPELQAKPKSSSEMDWATEVSPGNADAAPDGLPGMVGVKVWGLLGKAPGVEETVEKLTETVGWPAETVGSSWREMSLRRCLEKPSSNDTLFYVMLNFFFFQNKFSFFISASQLLWMIGQVCLTPFGKQERNPRLRGMR